MKEPTGLLVLHGNRLELLAEAVFAWLAAHPLAALEPETVLVQSNGMAEWLKMELASAHGICAAMRIELPARFIWRAYRAVLGRSAVPAASALDKLPLTWRLMRRLPHLADQPGFEPVAGFLAAGDVSRRLQLAQRLADLFDQYQVYRSDWLDDWGQGIDILRNSPSTPAGSAGPVPAQQLWQPALWRALLAELSELDAQASRSTLQRRFVQALQQPAPHELPGARMFPDLPRRIVLFGTTHIPQQTLEAITALAAHCQVLLAVPNPCRFHWADTIDGRELLRFARRRQTLRADRDLSAVPLQEMHAHGHPLLSAWGRQSRDFVRQLDAFDDVQAAQRQFEVPRVDLFDEASGVSLLQQVQAAVRDMLPLSEHAAQGAKAADRSIVFHVAHSAQREVEILHDQLLHLLAQPKQPATRALNPRDIVVMVPDIDSFAPAIRSVFGQYPRWDARHIPWGIADQKDRGHQPLLVALEWLLRAPQQRFGASQVRDLLDVAAVARRCGLQSDDLPTLVHWTQGSGIRWGLDSAHRDSLGLGASGAQNTWAFGLHRMLLGYATGDLPGAEGYAGIEPYAEVAGLDAALAGSLAGLLHTLNGWCSDALSPRTPQAWAQRLRTLLDDLFEASDDSERALLAALNDALASWLLACESADFDDPLALAVVREAWLEIIDAPSVSQRFKAGGVTFCTLLPLRAIPFEVVCLLGMNDGDYPRRSTRSDFDLMALPGQARPGDRSRRDDDRQLMLDALLSARQTLYISWAGRSQRDNQELPPSVLVAQLRDYLGSGWGPEVLAQRTTEHPLQPFSRRYFEPAAVGSSAALFTYAAEWRKAHADADADADAADAAVAVDTAHAAPSAPALQPPPASDTALHHQPVILTVQGLAAFLRNPVKEFFKHRLQVSFVELEDAAEDDESFGGQGLERWRWLKEVLVECSELLDVADDAETGLETGSETGSEPGSEPGSETGATVPPPLQNLVGQQLARLQRAGRLPIGGPGQWVQQELLQSLLPMITAWQSVLTELPLKRDKLALHWAHPENEQHVLSDWLVGLRAADADGPPVWIELLASKVADPGTKKRPAPTPRADKMLSAWVRCLASAACGNPTQGIVLGEGALVQVRAPEPADAQRLLADLVQAWHQGVQGDQPWPTAVKTGTAWLKNPDLAAPAFEGQFRSTVPGEGQEACLARLFPDFASLCAAPNFEAATRRLYEPFLSWLSTHTEARLLDAEPTEPTQPTQPTEAEADA